MSEFDQVLYEDNRTNRMHEALNLVPLPPSSLLPLSFYLFFISLLLSAHLSAHAYTLSFSFSIRFHFVSTRLFSALTCLFVQFKEICLSKWFMKSTIVLFLNKADLLEKKLKEGKSIVTAFPEYKGTFHSLLADILVLNNDNSSPRP